MDLAAVCAARLQTAAAEAAHGEHEHPSAAQRGMQAMQEVLKALLAATPAAFVGLAAARCEITYGSLLSRHLLRGVSQICSVGTAGWRIFSGAGQQTQQD